MATRDDIDETARLILMDQPKRFIDFTRELRAEYPGIAAESVAMLWGKYCGFDGRSWPTHSIETGAPL